MYVALSLKTPAYTTKVRRSRSLEESGSVSMARCLKTMGRYMQ